MPEMNPCSNIKIFYFSGTGNSRNVARWFSESAASRGSECSISDIAAMDRISIPKPESGSLLVFVSPVHGFNYPPVMLRFIRRFPRSNNKVLLMNTRAGMKIGNWNVPGLSGISLLLSALILILKGYSITGMVPFDLPSNWISLHPGLNERTVEYLHSKNKERVLSSARKVLSGGSDFRGLKDIAQDLIISPISLGYYFIGRFFFAKSFYASRDCSDCDLCISSCPVKAIIKVDNRPYWTFNCESCMKCMGNCPKKAIQTAHGFIIPYMLYSSTLTAFFLHLFHTTFFKIENGFVNYIFVTLLFLFFLGLLYRILHYLMRFRFIDRLMVYSSLTSYKFWGRRYKALKNF